MSGSTMPPDLDALLSQLRTAKADPSELITSFRKHVRAMARRHLPPGDALRRILDSEDLAQETLLELVRGIDRFTGSSWEEFLAFTRSVMVQRVADKGRHLRRSKRNPDLEQPLSAEDLPSTKTPTPSVLAASAEERARVQELMAGLPEPLRTALTLRLSGSDYAPLAQKMGISEESARQRVSRALAWLKKRW